MDYDTIRIKRLSAPVLKKLQKGMRVKVQKGDDMSIAVDKSKVKQVEKAFRNNRGTFVSLSPTEIETSMKVVGKGRERIGLRSEDVSDYATNPLLFGYDTATGVLPVVAPKKTKAEDRDARARVAKVRKDVKKVGKYINPVSLVGMVGGGSGSGLYASPQGGALYAQRRMYGRGTRLLDQKFSAREAGQFLTKELPSAFAGGSLQRNTQHKDSNDLYVGGDLLSDFEMHPAMRSQPLHENFALTRTLPPQFQKYHKTVI